MPWKTMLTAALFTAAMVGLKLFDPGTIPQVWQMPLPKPPVIAVAPVKRLAVDHAGPPPSPAYANLSDPQHELDHFYAALDKRDAVVLHYGDSPTTADLPMPRDAAILRPRISLDIAPSSWICTGALDFSAEEPAGQKNGSKSLDRNARKSQNSISLRI